ncbi:MULTISPECIES: YycH family regulatory protein [unclassified Bacillus (in: firmicutes)]|uniref:YycH family regulatory protein n=1 Tax=unclassified Bacillus (in: firmicutes) TaxID=185979 RepID=UPI0008E5F522|nr:MULTISPECIES: two-component system activity regulator YycH [unclassified Bacillus (in: firmicutes)]SFB01943.1 Two-component signal transduction system YycFG, regulatory protein YycH [Bacillus sp. UNCCL13]SFQ89209.1 Two-component signal transduction system YycFG, regulatory protein YycH [Bacillus sp. cl95]
MRYENIKSGVLIALVLISAILTWNLWTYQPNHEKLNNANYIEEVEIGEKKDIKKIIRPDRILYHVKDQHYGTSNSNDIDKVMREMGSWVFYDVENDTEHVQNFKELVHGKGKVEIVYPEGVPIELYKGVLDFEEKKLPNFEFDRIVMDVENLPKDSGTVYFVSYKNREVYKARVTPSFLNDFHRDFYKNVDQLPRFQAFDTEKRVIYLPEEATVMVKYKYLPHNLNSEEFKEALFNDPSSVKKSIVQDGEEYADVSSLMNIDYRDNMLLYVNPGESSDYIARPYDLLKQSIDFINEHGGWTDGYRFVSMDEINQKVTFRLFSIEGYPVFNERGMSEITEVWGRNEINKYIRPNFELGFPLRTEMSSVTLPSGKEVLEYLQKREGFKPHLLEELILGYRMDRVTEEQRLIVLEPTWFYRYDKAWGQISQEDLGGLKRGLE